LKKRSFDHYHMENIILLEKIRMIRMITNERNDEKVKKVFKEKVNV